MIVARHRLIAAALALVAVACDRSGTPRPKNLLIVCVDTLRADELGAYGKEPSITPALDRLAEESVVFERAHATASWTLPSIGSVFTSFFPSTTGLWNFDSRLADAFPTLAERFQAAGFDTHGIASHVFFQAKYGLVQGFDAFDDELCHRKGEPGWQPVTSPAVSAKAVRWLEERAQSGATAPWLLFAHFFDPHVDYLDHESANPAVSARPERERYRSEIALTDRHVGAVLAALERSGFGRDTVVVFFSDHGESFLEHPGIARHSYSLYEEELRVPLFLRVPGETPQRRIDNARTVDLLPTLLELFGLADEHLREGVSLLLSGEPPEPRPQLAEIRLKEGFHANALVSGSLKLYEDVSNGHLKVYDLEADPAEQHDLSQADPRLRDGLEFLMRAAIRDAEAKGARFGAGGSVELSPEERRNLEELGYAGREKEVAGVPFALLLSAFQGSWPQPGPSREAALAQCADCHPSETETYARTGMARALEPLRAGELGGFAPVAEQATGFVYSFEGDGKGARLVETRSDGPWRDSAPIAFAIGAGELDRSFAVTRERRLWLAPLEVFGKESERHAALAPGHTIHPGSRFGVPITPECLGCHTDAPPPRAWPLNLVPADWAPRGISCGACHGDLAGHVRAKTTELAGEAASAEDPLDREAGWNRVQRMERCAACHLQGDARVELVPGRLGPPPPGTPLLATRAVFVAREPADEVGFVSHVQRLVLSRCYLESTGFPRGGLSCESCHDPHRSVFDAGERVRVRAACLRCHEPESEVAQRASDCALPRGERPSERDCAACHMQRTGVHDVAEVEIHDHWIRREPAVPSSRSALRFAESASGDWRLFAWPDGPAPEYLEDPGPWTMALFHGGHLERAQEFLQRGEGTRAKELAMLHHVRGSLLERAGDNAAARAAYERALALDRELAEAAINLAPVLAHEGEAAKGKELLDALIARHPSADTAYRNRATVRLALGDDAGFRADVEAAMKLLPDAALAQAFARYLAQRGDVAGERRWNERARWLDPRVP